MRSIASTAVALLTLAFSIACGGAPPAGIPILEGPYSFGDSRAVLIEDLDGLALELIEADAGRLRDIKGAR